MQVWSAATPKKMEKVQLIFKGDENGMIMG
jgi:hypothetical protein